MHTILSVLLLPRPRPLRPPRPPRPPPPPGRVRRRHQTRRTTRWCSRRRNAASRARPSAPSLGRSSSLRPPRLRDSNGRGIGMMEWQWRAFDLIWSLASPRVGAVAPSMHPQLVSPKFCLVWARKPDGTRHHGAACRARSKLAVAQPRDLLSKLVGVRHTKRCWSSCCRSRPRC